MRTRLLLLATALLTGGLASPALAAPPVPVESQPPQTFPLCGTEVTISEEVNRTREHKDGRITGALKLRVTNDRTRRSIVVNASGPGRVVETDLGGGRFQLDFSFTGRSLIFPFIPGEVPFFRAAGLPDLFVTKGPFRQTTVIDVSGIDETTPPPVVGFTIDVPNRVEDLCDDIT